MYVFPKESLNKPIQSDVNWISSIFLFYKFRNASNYGLKTIEECGRNFVYLANEVPFERC